MTRYRDNLSSYSLRHTAIAASLRWSLAFGSFGIDFLFLFLSTLNHIPSFSSFFIHLYFLLASGYRTAVRDRDTGVDQKVLLISRPPCHSCPFLVSRPGLERGYSKLHTQSQSALAIGTEARHERPRLGLIYGSFLLHLLLAGGFCSEIPKTQQNWATDQELADMPAL